MNGNPKATVRCTECDLLVPSDVHLGNLKIAVPGPHVPRSDGSGFAAKGSPPCPGHDKLGVVVSTPAQST